MKKTTGKKPSPRVALFIESSRSYGPELLMGVAKYVRIHGPWSIEFEEGHPGEQFPKWFGRWKRDGIIARVTTPAKAEILRVRLDRVCRLLVESDLSLAEVGHKAGFEHPEYMSRLIKKKLGITPGEFRKSPGAAHFPGR
jgi:AraC-like DNA-binding protein